MWHTLWHEVFTGPPTAYQSRLVGPNSWSGARDAILSQRERIESLLWLPLLERGMDCTVDAGEESCLYSDFTATCNSYILFFIEFKVCFTVILLNTLL